MIAENTLFLVGKITKTHSLYGEVVCELSRFDIDEDSGLDYVVVCVDDIYVPFFIEEMRTKNAQSVLLKLEDVDTEKEARSLVGKQVFLPLELIPESEDEPTWDNWIDFAVCDVKFGMLGSVVQVDDSTLNVLLVIEGNRGEILVPAIEDFIRQVDYGKQVILVDIPEALLDLSKAETED